MALTAQQKATLKAYIEATPELAAQPNIDDGAFAIAAIINQEASPAWVVWKTSVSRKEILQNGFDWTRLDNLSVGSARVWNDMFVDGFLNAGKANVRAGIEAVWKGTAADLAQRANIYTHCKRNATVVQKLFSTGTGSDATPATLDDGITDTYQISYADVAAARNS